MTASARRLLLYGVGVVLLAALAWLGFVRRVPADAGTRLSGARLHASVGNFDQALKTCDELLEEQPDCIDAQVFRATFLSMAERHEEALAAYDEVLAVAADSFDEPTRRDLVQDRASVLLAAGRLDEFEEARAELLRDPADPRPYVLDGLRAETEGDWDLAAEAYRAVLERSPDDARTDKRLLFSLLTAGDSALNEGDARRAAARFDEARRLRADWVPAHLSAAEARRRMGEQEAAVNALADAVALDPEAVRDLLASDPAAWKSFHDREVLAGLCPETSH